MKNILVILLIATFLLFPTVSSFAKSFHGVSYTIIEKSSMGSIKLSIDIKLEQKVSKDFLQKFALKLRQDEPIKYDRIFILYLLPGMTPGEGAWATSHFNPNLKVEILGTTIEEEKSLMSKPKDSSAEIIGEWLYEGALGAKYTLLKKNGKTIMICKYKDGSGSEKEMIQRKQSGKLRFEEKEGNDLGEYYLIESNGRLSIYDNLGLIFSMRPIK